MMAKKIEFKVHVVGRVTKEGLPRLVQRVSSLLPGKRLVDSVTEYVFHVPVLLGSNILPYLLIEEVEVGEGSKCLSRLGGIWFRGGWQRYRCACVVGRVGTKFEADRIELGEEWREQLHQTEDYRKTDGRYVVPFYHKVVQGFLG